MLWREASSIACAPRTVGTTLTRTRNQPHPVDVRQPAGLLATTFGGGRDDDGDGGGSAGARPRSELAVSRPPRGITRGDGDRLRSCGGAQREPCRRRGCGDAPRRG